MSGTFVFAGRLGHKPTSGNRAVGREPRRARTVLPPLIVLAVILSLGWAAWHHLRNQMPEPMTSPQLANTLEQIPADWLIVQADPEQVETFFLRLPRVKKWLAKADELERRFPPTAEERHLERLTAGTRAVVFAASPQATAGFLYMLQAFGNPFVPPNDLQGMVRAHNWQERLRKQEPEFAFLSVKAGAYQPERVLPARLSVGHLGGKPAWRLGDTYYLEAEPGVLVSSVSKAGVARLAARPVPPAKHLPAPPGACAVLQLSPEFLRAPLWTEMFPAPAPKGANDKPAPAAFRPERLGTVQFIARLTATGLALELRIPIVDDDFLAECRKHFDKQAGARPVAPMPDWAKNVQTKLEGRCCVVRFEVADDTIDRLIPTPEEVQGMGQTLEIIRRMFEKRGTGGRQ